MKKKRLIAWLMAIAMVIGVFSPVGGMKKVEAADATYYVSQIGDDNKDGKSEANAFQSLKKAFDTINADDTIATTDTITIEVTGIVNATEEALLSRSCHIVITKRGEAPAIIKRSTVFDGSIVDVNATDAVVDFFNIILDGGVVWASTPEVEPLLRNNVAGGILLGTSVEPVPVPGNMDAALRVTAGSVRMDNCEIRNNCNTLSTYRDNDDWKTTYRGGGGVHIDKGASFETRNSCKIHDNYARHQGGGIWNDGTLTLDKTEVYGNRSDDWGGGVYQNTNDNALTLIRNSSKVRNNSAGGSGGGINIYHGNFNISNTDVYGNFVDADWSQNDSENLRALGGGGIRIEYAAANGKDENNEPNGYITLGENVKVYGNSAAKSADGTGTNSAEKSATGVMIDTTHGTVKKDDSFSVSVTTNYVSNQTTNQNKQYYDPSDGYYKPGDENTPEYNIGGVNADKSATPKTTDPENIVLAINQDGYMSVKGSVDGVDNPKLTYQWYEISGTGQETELPNETKPTLKVPSDTAGTKNYYCVVTYQDGNKLPASVTSNPATARVVNLTANDFIVTTEQLNNSEKDLSKLDDTEAEKYADVELDNINVTPSQVTATSPVTFDKMKENGPGNEYDITYTDNGTGVKVPVKMMVVDGSNEGTYDDPADPTRNIPVKLGANDIEVDESEILGKTLPELKDLLKELGDPKATDDGNRVDPAKINVTDVKIYDDDGNLLPKPTVTFEYKGVTYDSPIKVNTDVKYPAIKADDFIINVDDAKKATNDDIKEESDAKLFENPVQSGDPSKVNVDPDGKKALNNANPKDDVKIKLTGSANGKDAEPKTVTAHVVDKVTSTDDSKVNSTDGHDVSIGANNITIGKDEIPKDETELKKLLKDLGKPVATDNGTTIPTTDPKITIGPIDIYEKGTTTPKAEPTVTFEYDGVKVTVPVKITDTTLTAKDFEVPAGSTPLTEDDFKKKAEVTAKDQDGKDVPVKVDDGDLTKLNEAIANNQPGTVPVKVTTPDGKEKTVNVNVTKGGDTIGDDRTYEISNPQDIPQDLDKGKVVDKISLDGKDLPADSYVIDGDKLTIKPSAMDGKPVGKYPVVITYKDGSKRTFNVNVIEYDQTTVVPLKKVPIFNMQKDIGVGKKFKLNLVGMNKNAYIDPKNTKTSNKKIATIDPKNLVIKANKRGKCNIQAAIIQNGSYYSVKIKLVVKKKMTMYNLKNAALVKKEGTLPEFNVYKRVVKGKKTKLKFTQIAKNAKITYTSSNKKVATISKKGVITGKKKGFTKVTAKIEQEGHVYYTRLFVRVDDGTKNKQLKKYLTTKVK